jgi:hypothetical protein
MLSRIDFARDHRALFDHIDACWREACDGRAMPRRQDITPSRLGRALPFVALLDVVDADPIDFRYRLIGQHLILNTGQNLTGKRTLELPQASPNGRPIYDCFAACAKNRAPGRLSLDVLNMNGTKRHMAMAVWPLSDDGDVSTGLLGAAHFQE